MPYSPLQMSSASVTIISNNKRTMNQEIFLKWIFYWYLATIRLVLDVLTQRENKPNC